MGLEGDEETKTGVEGAFFSPSVFSEVELVGIVIKGAALLVEVVFLLGPVGGVEPLVGKVDDETLTVDCSREVK